MTQKQCWSKGAGLTWVDWLSPWDKGWGVVAMSATGRRAALNPHPATDEGAVMEQPAIPGNEPQRIRALCALQLLDSPAEERFDRITRSAKRHFQVPIGLVSLVDAERQWFKSRQGLDAAQTPRDISFCGHAILADDIFHVPNALVDRRFADNPLVTGPPDIRFYAGAPLRASGGERVGTLCLIDRVPRNLGEEDLAVLRDLADAVERELALTQLRADQGLLRSTENRLRAVIETVVDGIVTIDRSGLMHTFNPAAERLFGYRAAEVIGRNVNMLMPEPYRGEHDGYLSHYLGTGERRVIGIGREVTGQRQDGSIFPMYLAVSEMQLNGERHFTGIVRDISAQKHIEQALLLAVERAEAADRLKSTFLATMSHELRTPLNSIIGFTGILLQGLAGPLNPEQDKQLGMVQTSARHLLALINDVLDISKIEAGELQVDCRPFDLHAALTRVAGIMRPLAQAKGLDLRLELPPMLQPLHGDQRRVEQIVLNLLSNAVKFSEHGEVVLTAVPEAACVCMHIGDTGIGIKPEDMHALFLPFRQIDTGLARHHEGTGLGLAICRRLADLMGGEIRAQSEWGKGSTFTFMLPFQGAPNA